MISLVLWFSGNAEGYTSGWYGWPCPTNADWNGACSSNHYFFQLYTALVERCVAVNQNFTPIVDTGVSLYNGYTNNLVSTNGVTVTNPVIQYKTVSLTNQFLPFTYTYDNGFVSGVATCNPPMRYSWFTAWDSQLFAIAPYYVNTNRLGTNNNWDAWFLSPGNISNTAASFPKFASTSLLDAAGIGWTNRTVAHWTISHAQSSSDWQMGQIYSSGPNGTSWLFRAGVNLDPWHPTANESIRPIVQYVPGGTNDTLNISISISGTAWTSNGNTSASASETALFLSTNSVTLTQLWRSVSSMVCTSSRANSNDAFRMQYLMLPDLFASSASRRLSAEAMNERKACVDKLLWSDTSGSSALVCNNLRTGRGWDYGYDPPPVNPLLWEYAKGRADTNWPGTITNYEGRARCGSRGRNPGYPYNFLEADLDLTDWTLTNAPPTNATCAASCEYYIYAKVLSVDGFSDSLGTLLFDDIGGYGFIRNTYKKVGASTESVGGRIMDTEYEYSGVPAWCDGPGIENGTSLGYEVMNGAQKILYKWDGPNGFKYK